ncbi:hypothetical protein FVE85_3498 [Porphyridium purpureum]|uniref:Uncharacterized protein n=1 Tax=Porphyridium purpureum TaxID=35688 RepID=A0A5J4YMA2_PORPP|nr:hypothetical protein FVE85_3498 [Porphyridium purpureum]|eukprot:POR0781..scf249_10
MSRQDGEVEAPRRRSLVRQARGAAVQCAYSVCDTINRRGMLRAISDRGVLERKPRRSQHVTVQFCKCAQVLRGADYDGQRNRLRTSLRLLMPLSETVGPEIRELQAAWEIMRDGLILCSSREILSPAECWFG